MAKLTLPFFILVTWSVLSNANVTRRTKAAIDFESFLRQSVHGTPTEPATPELAELQNVWENSGKFQGDILLTEERIQEIVNEFVDPRNAITNQKHLWPQKTVIYYFSSSVSTSLRDGILAAMKELSKVSCVKFRARTSDDPYYVRIQTTDSGCFAHVGYWTSGQTLVNLGSGCSKHGTILHELMHTLGFEHMQCSHNRDDYVKIIWNKIKPGKEYAFQKYTSSQVTNFGEGYDYLSRMHYSAYSFSVDGSKTIETLQPGGENIGQKDVLSSKDIKKLNKLYECA